MNTLRMLGGLSLEPGDTGGRGRTLQRHRLALLALICLSPHRRVTRDKVLSLLWPESPAREGRNRLSTAVYDIRQVLGSDVLRSAGDDLWMPDAEPGVATLASDVERFERAVADADWESALATYRGPLLDGVHVGELHEFDEWIAGHRERLRRAHVGATECAMDARVAAQEFPGAAAAARQLASLEPLSERVALRVAEIIAQCDGPTAAVQSLEHFSERVQQEFALAPSPAVTERLRTLRVISATVGVAAPAADPAPAALVTSAPAPGASAATIAPPTVRRAPMPTLFRTAAALGVAVTAVMLGRRAGADSVGDAGDLPVRWHNAASPRVSGAESDALRQQVAVALNTIDACAADGALGAMAAVGGRCVASVEVTTQDTAVVLRATLQGQASGAALSTAEQVRTGQGAAHDAVLLARALVAGALEGANHHLAASAMRSTTRPAAMHAFLVGDAHFRHGFYSAARTSFAAAVAADSAFALAHYRLSQTLLWEDVPASLASAHDTLAVRYAASLPPEDQRLVQAYMAWRTGDAARAESLCVMALRSNPRDVEAHMLLAETRFHYFAPQGRDLYTADGEFDWVVALDSANWGARWHRVLLDARRDPAATIAAKRDALLRGHEAGYIAEELRLFAVDRGAPLLATAATATTTVLFDAAWRRAVFRGDLDGAAALLRVMSQGDRPRAEQEKAGWLLAAVQLGRGEVPQALALLPLRQPGADAGEALIIAAQAAVAGALHRGPADADSLYLIVQEWQHRLAASNAHTPETVVVSDYLLGLLAAARGRAEAARYAAALEARADTTHLTHTLAAVVRAMAAERRDRCGDALAALDAGRAHVWLGVTASSALASNGMERLLRGRCLVRLGRPREAVAWFASMGQHTLYDLALLVPALREQARALRLLGDASTAEAIERRVAGP